MRITVASAALLGALVAAPAVMQAGFAMLEAGSVGDSAVTNILFKASGYAHFTKTGKPALCVKLSVGFA
jgi:hypothetical protein